MTNIKFTLSALALLSFAAMGADAPSVQPAPAEQSAKTNVQTSAPVESAQQPVAAPAASGDAAKTEQSASPAGTSASAQPVESPEPPAPPEPPESAMPRVAVFPFSCIDIQGLNLSRFTDRIEPNRRSQETLAETERDRMTIDEKMLGTVRSIDVRDEADYRRNLRTRLNRENDRNLARQLEIYDKIVQSSSRTMVIGAEYMEAELGRYDTVEVVDSSSVRKAFSEMRNIQAGGRVQWSDFNAVGATHILYGIVADMRTESKQFSGYGATTITNIYSLDVLFKLVNIRTGQVDFSGVYTGHDRVFQTEYLSQMDSDRFGKLMKDAVAQAAAAIDSKFEKEKK
ncbi:MAG: hypothetical protein MJ025_00325 [Victivallaceae bacterium]|nr:hypothetical protein [Victivallaceae bacterium]